MENPVAEISQVIKTLTTAPPCTQRETIDAFFTPHASFTHPFCRTGSSSISKWLIIQIYRWYKILSPHIDIEINSIAFDQENLLLYVSIYQVFSISIVPFYSAPVKLVSVLQLTTDGPTARAESVEATPNELRRFESKLEQESGPKEPASGKGNTQLAEKAATPPYAGLAKTGFNATKPKYYISAQNDLYQTDEFVKFILPWGFGVSIVLLWHYWATAMCVLGVTSFDILTWPLRTLGLYDRYRNKEEHE